MAQTEKTCTLLFLVRDGEILLADKKRGFGKDLINGIGGKIEQGETIEQALLRETNEEIAVTPMRYRKVAEHNFRQDEGKDPWRMYVHVYLCDEWQGKPSETDEMRPRWYKLEDIPYAEMWADDEFWLPQVLAGKKVYGEFSFNEQNQLLKHNVEIVETLPHEALESN